MSGRSPVLEPLRREPPAEGTAAARLGAVARAVSDAPALGDDARARILRHLRAGGDAPDARRRGRIRPLTATAIAVCLLLMGLGASAGVSWMRGAGILFPSAAQSDGVPEPAVPEAADRGPTAPAPAPVAPELAPPGDAVGTAPAPAPAPAPARRARPANRAAAPARETPPSPLAHEARLLARALDQLRANRDYAGALATLAEYDARFPAGVMRSEATLARLDALVAIGSDAAALRLLDDPATIRGPRALELLVLRGELRAAAGRHADAIQDFDRVLARKPPDALGRRALYGRASSRSRAGDQAGAESDVGELRARTPDARR